MKRISEEREQEVITLYKSGLSLNEIHYRTNLAVLTISSVLARNGVEKRVSNNIGDRYSKEELYDYYINHSSKEFEEHFGFESTCIYQHIKDLPKKQDNVFYKTVDKEEFIKLYAEKSNAELAKYYNVSVSKIGNTASKLNCKKKRGWNQHAYKRNSTTPDNFIEKQREMVNYLAEKYSGEDIAILLGKTPARICQILNSK